MTILKVKLKITDKKKDGARKVEQLNRKRIGCQIVSNVNTNFALDI